jgi:hypothetical protein
MRIGVDSQLKVTGLPLLACGRDGVIQTRRIVRADQQPMSGEQRQAQDGRRRPEDNIEQVEDEEAEDDEDEADGLSQRP